MEPKVHAKLLCTVSTMAIPPDWGWDDHSYELKIVSKDVDTIKEYALNSCNELIEKHPGGCFVGGGPMLEISKQLYMLEGSRWVDMGNFNETTIV